MNFRKRIKICPGVTINLSKSGISTTIGVKGCNVNFSERGVYLNTGIPGTGLYSRKKIDGVNKFQDNSTLNKHYFETIDVQHCDYTTKPMSGLKEQILTTWTQRSKLLRGIKVGKKIIRYAAIVSALFGLFTYSKFANFIKYGSLNSKRFGIINASITLAGISVILFVIIKSILDKKLLKKTVLNVDMNVDEASAQKFNDFLDAYNVLRSSERIYYISDTQEIDSVQQRTAARYSVSRHKVNIYDSKFQNFIITPFDPVILSTSDNRRIFMYPGFVIYLNENMKEPEYAIHLCEWKNINLVDAPTSYIEEESVPSDSQVIGYTWKYINKNGSPDRRYSNNYQIPIVKYYEFIIVILDSLQISYIVSNEKNAIHFCNELRSFKNKEPVQNSTTGQYNNVNSKIQTYKFKRNEELAEKLDNFFENAVSKIKELIHISEDDNLEKLFNEYCSYYNLDSSYDIIDLMKYDLLATAFICRYETLTENLHNYVSVWRYFSLYFKEIEISRLSRSIENYIDGNTLTITNHSLDLLTSMVIKTQKTDLSRNLIVEKGIASIIFDYIDILKLFTEDIFKFGKIPPSEIEKKEFISFFQKINKNFSEIIQKAANREEIDEIKCMNS